MINVLVSVRVHRCSAPKEARGAAKVNVRMSCLGVFLCRVAPSAPVMSECTHSFHLYFRIVIVQSLGLKAGSRNSVR